MAAGDIWEPAYIRDSGKILEENLKAFRRVYTEGLYEFLELIPKLLVCRRRVGARRRKKKRYSFSSARRLATSPRALFQSRSKEERNNTTGPYSEYSAGVIALTS